MNIFGNMTRHGSNMRRIKAAKIYRLRGSIYGGKRRSINSISCTPLWLHTINITHTDKKLNAKLPPKVGRQNGDY